MQPALKSGLKVSECIHGEPRGSSACALCRYQLKAANRPITPPPVERNTVSISKAHPQTSRTAAQKAFLRSGTRRKMIYELIKRHYEVGLCDHEIIEITALSPNTARPTRISLMKDGLIADSGKRRKTPDGNDAIVWRVSA
jgi:hypothetical protein